VFLKKSTETGQPAIPSKSRNPLFLGDLRETLIILVPLTFLGIIFFFGIALLFGHAPQNGFDEIWTCRVLVPPQVCLTSALMGPNRAIC